MADTSDRSNKQPLISGDPPLSADTTPPKRGRSAIKVALPLVGLLLVGAATAWAGHKAFLLHEHLESAADLMPALQGSVERNDSATANQILNELKHHTAMARDAASDPLWATAQAIPWLGANFRAAGETAISADDVVNHAAVPLVEALGSLEWKNLTPDADGLNLEPLAAASPRIVGAAHAVRESLARLDGIAADTLLPSVSEPLIRARDQLRPFKDSLEAAGDASLVLPDMMGAENSRKYLLLIQNNAEARATGGIPGAVALLEVERGKVVLRSQTSATALGPFDPVVKIDPEQEAIYSARTGKFMQDVNLTPDFPTTATVATSMWERRTKERVDGVISIDPVALSYILKATGPVAPADPDQARAAGLPTSLTEHNVLSTLLSDVYAKIPEPQLHDKYFAGVAKEVLNALSVGGANPKELAAAISRSVNERRLLAWSSLKAEQGVIAKYRLGGSISGSSVAPTEFGVYFNDGTGAKMDYYMKRQVELLEECTADEYSQVKVRVTSTNTAPPDASSSLPWYVTGGGQFGIPPGSVQTNIVTYGPVQSRVESALLNGKKISFGAQQHSGRPVGTVTVLLSPGETVTTEVTFSRIVQYVPPTVAVTPTVQPIKDVVLPLEPRNCRPPHN